MLSPACFRKAKDPSRALVQAVRGNRLHGGLGTGRPSTTTAVVVGHGSSRTTTSGVLEPVRDRRRAITASSEGRNLWTSSAMTHHLSVAEHRCLSQDSRKLEQQPCSPCPPRYGQTFEALIYPCFDTLVSSEQRLRSEDISGRFSYNELCCTRRYTYGQVSW